MASRQYRDWSIQPSAFARRFRNPIGKIYEEMVLRPNPDKEVIALSIGDPTVSGVLKTSNRVTEALVESVRSMKYNGYAKTSTGHLEARQAVAKYASCPGAELQTEDVILCSGVSQSLELSILALANPGQNILVPRPGFPLCETLASCEGIECKQYNLLPDRNWEVDFDHLVSLIDEQTAAIVINNPSNPCGSVYGKEHLLDLLRVCEKYRIPIIADQVYDYMVFEGHEFFPIASLSTEVPVLTCGGLTKRFLVPGWRMGWLLIHDRKGRLAQGVRQSLPSLTQRILGSSTVLQGALPAILANPEPEMLSKTIQLTQTNAKYTYGALVTVPGVKPVMPSGAIYMMVGFQLEHFPSFATDLELIQALMAEQSVFCLPGTAFGLPGYLRITLTIATDQMIEACDRIAEFFRAHYVETPSSPPCVSAEESMSSVGNGHLSSGEWESAAESEVEVSLRNCASPDRQRLVSCPADICPTKPTMQGSVDVLPSHGYVHHIRMARASESRIETGDQSWYDADSSGTESPQLFETCVFEGEETRV